jgi:hypothetical protein
MNRLTEAFLKFSFVINYKKGSEMPADFLSQNGIDAVGIFQINGNQHAVGIFQINGNKQTFLYLSLYHVVFLDQDLGFQLSSAPGQLQF